MHFSSVFLLAASPILASPVKRWAQEPFRFPLANGFPNPDAAALEAIQKQAQGTLPNTPLPTEIADTSAVVWSLIAFNEIFEVAFFTSLIQNITSKVPGYESCDEKTLAALTAIQAQEELHALGANAVLTTAGRAPVEPCEYIFPTANLADALAFASTFTDLVLGTLQTALTAFGLDQDIEFLGLVGSVIGQEGEQDGYFRASGGKIPSQLPFLTVGGPPFAYSALNQMVVYPGSCKSQLAVPLLQPLKVLTPPAAQTQSIKFSYPGSQISGLSLVYINQQNKPIVESIADVQVAGDSVVFSAAFPYETNLLNGLTIATVVKGSGPFANASEVADAAVYGPGLIEVN